MAASSGSLVTAIIVDIIVLAIITLLFCVLRVNSWSRQLWAPRTYAPKLHPHEVKPPFIPAGWKDFIAWLPSIFRLKEAQIIDCAGLDSAVLIRVLSFGMELFVYLTIFCCALQLPVNLTDNNIDLIESTDVNDKYKFTEFDKLGLANVTEGSSRMWLHMLSVYVILFIVMFLLNKYSREFAVLRVMFLAGRPKGEATHTVLVSDVPGVWADTKAKIKDIKEGRKEARKASVHKKDDDAHTPDDDVEEPSDDDKRPSPTGLTTPDEASGAVQGVPVESDQTHSMAAPVESDQTHSMAAPDEAAGAGSSTAPRGVAEADEGADSAPPEKGKKSAPDLAASGYDADALAGTFMAPPVRYHFTYDPHDESLMPDVQANVILGAGVPTSTMVENEFGTVYRGDVDEVHLVKDQSELWPLYTEYSAIKQNLEDYLDECEHRLENGLKVERRKCMIFPFLLGDWGKSMGYGGGLLKKVDQFEHWDARLRELDRLIAAEQHLTGQMIWPSAFVTFKTRRAQAAAVQGLHHHDTRFWLLRPAPEPKELVWKNLGLTVGPRAALSFGMWVLFWLGAFFFLIPVAAVQGLINITASSLPGMDNPTIQRLVEGVLPGLALIIFLAIVPLLLRIMMVVSGAISESEVDMGVVSRYYLFQVITVFFGSVVSGTFLNQINTWIDDPGAVLDLFGTAIPQVVTFFITYVAARSCIAQPLKALRLGAVIKFAILTKLTPSPKARARIWQLQYGQFGEFIGNHSIAMLLGLVYSCINPMMTPFCVLYFVINLAIQLFEQTYVKRRVYESAGMLWPKFLNHVMAGVYIQHIVMLALLGVKKFKFTPVLIPAPFIAIIFHVSIVRLYNRPWTYTSYHDATALDRQDEIPEEVEDPKEELLEEGGEENLPPAQAYLSPCFKVKEGEVLPLLDEAKIIAAKVDVRIVEQDEEKAAKKGKKKAPPAQADAPASATTAEA